MRKTESAYELRIFPFIEVEEKMECKEVYMTFLSAPAIDYVPLNFTAERQATFEQHARSIDVFAAPPALSEDSTIFPPGSVLPPTCDIDLAAMRRSNFIRLPTDVSILLNALEKQCIYEEWKVIKSDAGDLSYVLKGGVGTRASALYVINGTKAEAKAEIVKICTEWGTSTDSAVSITLARTWINRRTGGRCTCCHSSSLILACTSVLVSRAPSALTVCISAACVPAAEPRLPHPRDANLLPEGEVVQSDMHEAATQVRARQEQGTIPEARHG
jgi:hypothetical protein